MDEPEAVSQFYTGLVAELYEPVAGDPTQADDYVPWLRSVEAPVLELACGGGRPMLDLIERGFEIEGLDASADMLDVCRREAKTRGLAPPLLHEAEMQHFSLGRTYGGIFLAGASITLLEHEDDLDAVFACMAAHLGPRGGVLIPFEIPDLTQIRRQVGHFRETRDAAGSTLRVGLVSFTPYEGGHRVVRRLRYERIGAGGETEAIERDWVTRWWRPDEVVRRLGRAGFADATCIHPDGRPLDADDGPAGLVFVALAKLATQETS